jgi:drug/metabolite transporter (DMT)-like permease
VIVALALLAAFVFGGGVVFQQRAAMEVPAEHAARPALLARLIRHPLWLLGVVADVGGFGLQALALHRGSLVVVQPLITTSLLFTLALSAVSYHEPISRAEWRAVILVLAGLCVFLVAAAPTEESSVRLVGMANWLLCTGAVAFVTAALVGAGLRASGTARVALLAMAAGTADAFMAVLAKAFAGSFNHGVGAVMRSWTPYALVVGGVVALLLVSTAYQAGYPTVSLPIITVSDPLVSSLIGISLFGEEIRLDGARGPLVAVAVAVMAAGLVALGRGSRLTRSVHQQRDYGSAGAAAPGVT